MPSREEQVAQIEAALEQRFFPIVPQSTDPSHGDWTPDQHRAHRLSRALAAANGTAWLYDERAFGNHTNWHGNIGGVK
jgi:hypothetical protein